MADRLIPLISPAKLSGCVAELGRRISADYRGREPLVIGVLDGCFIFLADLLRRIECPVDVELVRVSSYASGTETSGVIALKDIDAAVAGRDVLLVEDIADSGLTLDFLVRRFRADQPASLKTCVLLDKAARRRTEVPLDYVGFEIPDRFVVGYGLDFNGRYRQLPGIFALERSNDLPTSGK